MSKAKPAETDSDAATIVAETITTPDGETPGTDVTKPVTAAVIHAEIMEFERANKLARRGPAGDRQDDVEISPASRAAMQAVGAWMEANRTHTASPDAAVADIIAQIMSSETIDDVLGDVTVQGWQSLEDVPVTILDGKFNRSDYEAGMPYYALVSLRRLDTGAELIVSTGAQSVLAQLVRLIQLQEIPCNVKLVKATKKPTESGYWPMRLARA
jgi:hypothetical protein